MPENAVIDFSSSDDRDKQSTQKLDFAVRDLFMFGSPVSLILTFRKINGELFKRKTDSNSSKTF